MKLASIVEMLNVPAAATRPGPLAQVSDESPRTFKESLLVASKASPSASAANQTGTAKMRRQGSNSADAKLPPNMPQVQAVPSPATPQQTVEQQAVVTQQLPMINPALVLMQSPVKESGLSASVAGQPISIAPTASSFTIESRLAQPVFAKSDSVRPIHAEKGSDPPQDASILMPAPEVPPIASTLSNAVTNVAASAISVTLPAFPSNAAPNADPGKGPSALPAEALNTIPITVPSAMLSHASKAVTGTVPSAFPGVAQESASPVVTNAMPNSSSSAGPAPVLRNAVNPSARGEVAPQSSSPSTSQANPPAIPPDPGGLPTAPTAPGATADQLLAMIQPGGGLPVAAKATELSASPAAVAKPSLIALANGKDGAKNAIVDAAGPNQHAHAALDQTGLQTGSQGTTPSDDQGQSSASQQGQSAVPAQVNFANHTISGVDHVQNLGVVAPLQTAPVLAGATGHTTTPDVAAPAAIALPQAVPVINTAKLIQSMGQSEMRVGIRSNEFGNISISTSATRDLISAQISLDHGELARTLAAHLPEMQARLGGNQAVDVRIDMNGQATAQGTGTSPGMTNGSADGSRGDRQQKEGATPGRSGGGFTGQGSSNPPGGPALGEGRLDARLDIRV